jgi:hypothetical protein
VEPKQHTKKGTRVSWVLYGGATVRGYGVVISHEEDGAVLVACDVGTFTVIPIAYHVVIHYNVNWLTLE